MSASSVSALRSRLTALADKAAAAAAPLTRTATAELDKVLASNAEYVVKDPVAASKLGRQWLFTSLARIPDGATRCKAEWGIVRSTWARRADLPSGEAGMYALFVGELFAWACVGEIVGRGGTFGGYQV